MAVELNPWAMQAIRNVKNGDTAYQKRRDLIRRGVVGGVQAGMVGIGGLLSAMSEKGQPQPKAPDNSAAIKSYDDRLNDAKREVMDRAITNASANNQRLHTQDAVPEAAKRIQESVSAAEAGIATPYGGYWNRRSFDEANQQAELTAHDMNVAKELMKEGDSITKGTGMGGTMRTWGR